MNDIQGEPRPSNSNPGADHYLLNSTATLFGPLSAIDVGPGANVNLNDQEFTFIKLQIAPNPASSLLSIQQIPQGIQYLQILNQRGQLIRVLKVEDKSSIKYDITQLPEGVYYVRFLGNAVFGYEKFIKSH